MAKTNVWGRRPLAYPVRKHREGIYMQFNYQLAPSAGRELERNLKIDEQVIRYLVVRLDSE
jgi:small subunit ribosomal protein S6